MRGWDSESEHAVASGCSASPAQDDSNASKVQSSQGCHAPACPDVVRGRTISSGMQFPAPAASSSTSPVLNRPVTSQCGPMAALNMRPAKQRKLPRSQRDSPASAEGVRDRADNDDSNARPAAEGLSRADSPTQPSARCMHSGKQAESQPAGKVAAQPSKPKKLPQIMVSHPHRSRKNCRGPLEPRGLICHVAVPLQASPCQLWLHVKVYMLGHLVLA